MGGRGRQPPRFSDTVVDADLVDTWEGMKKNASAAVDDERDFRRSIVDSLFSGAAEGSHNLDMSDGRVLNLSQSVDRKIDLATLDSIRGAMIEKFEIDPDTLIKWEPKLKVAAYRELPEDARAFFEQALTITDSMPSIKIVEPAAWRLAKAKAEAAKGGE